MKDYLRYHLKSCRKDLKVSSKAGLKERFESQSILMKSFLKIHESVFQMIENNARE